MEIRLNSGPDTPPGALLEHQTPNSIRTACLERERTNQYRMMVYWEGPRYPSFCSYTVRQRSFQNKNWPHKTLSIQALSSAGYFYTGKEICILLLNKTKQHTYSFYITPSHKCLSSPYRVRWRNKMFPLWRGIRGWEDDDVPWREHVSWFPNCVYIRYVKEGNTQQQDGNIFKKCTLI